LPITRVDRCGGLAGPTGRSYRNPAKTHVFTDSCSEPKFEGDRHKSGPAISLKVRKSKAMYKPLPLNFLLGCTENALANFELARLTEVADLRKELHLILDRLLDQMSQAAIAGWFRQSDRNAIKYAIENEETPLQIAARMIRDGQRSDEELIPIPSLPPGAAHLAASMRYQERNIAEESARSAQSLSRATPYASAKST
jgi:hypothetical protein